MQFFITSFWVVFPLLLKLALGYLIKRLKILSNETFQNLNNLVFRVLFPSLLFMNIYRATISEAFSWPLIIYTCCALLSVFALTMTIIPLLEKENRKRGVMVQAICRSNILLFGIPVATALYGQKSLAMASVLVGVSVPLINILAVISLEYFRGSKPDLKRISKGIISNPIIIGALLGVFFALTGLRLPNFGEQLIGELAEIATPLALITLGGTVTFSSIKNNRFQLLVGVSSRLIWVPLIGVPIAVLLGFRDAELVIILSLLASPSAITSYAMAVQMDGDGELAGQLVILTTVFSMLTLFLWITALLALGYF